MAFRVDVGAQSSVLRDDPATRMALVECSASDGLEGAVLKLAF